MGGEGSNKDTHQSPLPPGLSISPRIFSTVSEVAIYNLLCLQTVSLLKDQVHDTIPEEASVQHETSNTLPIIH